MGIKRQRTGDGVGQGATEHEVQSAKLRKAVSLDGAFDEFRELRSDTFGGNSFPYEVEVFFAEGDQRDRDDVSFIAGASVSELAEQHSGLQYVNLVRYGFSSNESRCDGDGFSGRSKRATSPDGPVRVEGLDFARHPGSG